MSKTGILSSFIVILAAHAFSQTAVKMKSVNDNGLPMATIPNTEVRTIKSEFTNDQYDLYFFLPTNYDKNVKYPLLVHLDAFFTFGGISDLVRNLQDSKLVKPFIIVGVDYGAGWGQKGNNRNRDLTFNTLPANPNTGGADKYISFFKNELLPFVYKNYPIDTTNLTLHGGSLGGTFGAYLMFKKDRIFNAFILPSPALNYHTNNILEVEDHYYKTNKALPVSLYISMGSNENKTFMLKSFYEFCGIVEKRKYEGLQMHVLIGLDQIHQTNDMYLMPKILMDLYEPDEK